MSQSIQRRGRRGRGRYLGRFLYVRLALLIPLLVAVFVLHVSGRELLVLRVARIVVLILVLLVLGSMRRRRRRPGI